MCAYSSGGERTAKNLFIFGSPELSYDYRDVDRQKKILADAFAGDGWEIPAMLENAAAARDFYFDSITLIEMDRWSKGRSCCWATRPTVRPRPPARAPASR
ncbi:hypothetical protein [Streptomyces sp. NPDC000880]